MITIHNDKVKQEILDKPNLKTQFITRRAFMQRFTQEERIAIRTSTNEYVQDIVEDIYMVEYIDVLHVDTQHAVAFFYNLGLIKEETMNKLLTAPMKAEMY